MPQDHVRQDLGGARGPRRPDLHRPAPRPRGHLAAGLRRPAACRSPGAPSRQDARHRRHNTPTDGTMAARADRRRALPGPGRNAGAQLRRVRHTALLAGLRAPGDRPRDRPGAGHHPAGHDDRLRRQPHLHPRRLRLAGLRHRHLRGRARPGHPVPGPEAAEDDADHLLGRARLRRHRQGPDPGDDRPPRHRRHGRPRGRVRRPGDRGALDAGPDDDLQHDDRGRRARRHDRPDEKTFEYVAGRPAAPGRTSTPPSSAGAAAHRRRRQLRHRGRGRCRARSRRWSPGARPRAWSSRSPTRSPTRPRWTRPPTASRPNARSPTWRWSRARR